mmetsp:Transcript_13997/g.28390  ORF Transcript_13997/g.28390 Transcript_13997/m.28390 type:complete len:171 (+) Transcript_13997:44-556(+)
MSRRLLAAALLLVQVAQPMRLVAPSRRGAPVAPMVARFAPLSMQEDGGREREQKKGRSTTIARPKAVPVSKNKEEVDKEGEWKVLLHNDDVHTFDYVNMAICKTVATVTRAKAHRITVAAHTNNLAVVTTTWKQMAKTYCLKLQKFGLTSSIAPGDGGGDDGGSDGPSTQ